MVIKYKIKIRCEKQSTKPINHAKLKQRGKFPCSFNILNTANVFYHLTAFTCEAEMDTSNNYTHSPVHHLLSRCMEGTLKRL